MIQSLAYYSLGGIWQDSTFGAEGYDVRCVFEMVEGLCEIRSVRCDLTVYADEAERGSDQSNERKGVIEQ